MRALATIAIPVVSFLVALVASSSLASSRTPGISTDIPSANLKEISLPQSQRLAINNLIGAAFGPRVGLSDESYDHVRELAQTSAGPLLAIMVKRQMQSHYGRMRERIEANPTL